MVTKFLKVTKIEYYAIDYVDKTDVKNDITLINGWSVKEIIKDWFCRKPWLIVHAARDHHHISNVVEIQNVELVDDIKNQKIIKQFDFAELQKEYEVSKKEKEKHFKNMEKLNKIFLKVF